MPTAYLLDIEGTTTPIDFVTKTLFPYARRALGDYLSAHLDDPALSILSEEHASEPDPPEWPDRPSGQGVAPYLEWLMDHDRKSTGLKDLQGRIWEEGYRKGELKGEIYPDVEPAIRRWRAARARVAIFSSGSVLAQKLLFSHLPSGDLTPLIDAHFDTTVGSKRQATSYARIAESLGTPVSEVLFLSDVIEEVEAARAAGMQAILIDRSGQTPDALSSFDSL